MPSAVYSQAFVWGCCIGQRVLRGNGACARRVLVQRVCVACVRRYESCASFMSRDTGRKNFSSLGVYEATYPVDSPFRSHKEREVPATRTLKHLANSLQNESIRE